MICEYEYKTFTQMFNDGKFGVSVLYSHWKKKKNN